MVSVTELEKLVNRLTEQSQIAESQRAQLAMRLSANNRDEETQRLLARTELGLRDVKTALRELEGEKEKLVAARCDLGVTKAKAGDRKRGDRKRPRYVEGAYQKQNGKWANKNMFPGREFDDLDAYRAAKKQRAEQRATYSAQLNAWSNPGKIRE